MHLFMPILGTSMLSCAPQINIIGIVKYRIRKYQDQERPPCMTRCSLPFTHLAGTMLAHRTWQVCLHPPQWCDAESSRNTCGTHDVNGGHVSHPKTCKALTIQAWAGGSTNSSNCITYHPLSSSPPKVKHHEHGPSL